MGIRCFSENLAKYTTRLTCGFVIRKIGVLKGLKSHKNTDWYECSYGIYRNRITIRQIDISKSRICKEREPKRRDKRNLGVFPITGNIYIQHIGKSYLN